MKQKILNASVAQRLPAAGYICLPTVLRRKYILSIGCFNYVARDTVVVVEGSGFKNMLHFCFCCQFNSASVPTYFRSHQKRMMNRLLYNTTPNKSRCHGIKHGVSARTVGKDRSHPGDASKQRENSPFGEGIIGVLH